MASRTEPGVHVIDRVHALFGEALDQPTSCRLSWLREQCGDDVALFAAVQRLLNADASSSLLDGDVAALAAPLAQPDTDATDAARYIGSRIGPYLIQSLLGRGGMGSVWLAQRDDGQLQQHVAIKLLAGALPSAEALQRFAQERQILVRLAHPNIARVLDAGNVDGVPWFAMEHVVGTPLDEYAQSQALDLHTRLALFAKVAAAVQFAHQNLVVHRDLKPSNILVDAAGEPRLLDFGVAKLLDAGSELTASRAPLSMAYAAPEQILGQPITTATDIYSLGVILYELLSGSRPHHARNSSLALLQAITDTDPQPPSRVLAGTGTTRGARQLRGDLDTIILTCLQRDPTRRYGSVQALLQDIDAYLRQLPIRARPDSWRYRSSKFIRRNPLGVIFGTLALVAVLGLSLYSLLKAREAELERSMAIDQAQRANAVQDLLIGLFEQQRPDASGGANISARDLLDRAERTLQLRTNLPAQTQAALLRTLGELRYDLGDFAGALKLNEQSLALAAAQHGESSAPYGVVLVARADSRQLLGESAPAMADCDQALPLLLDAPVQDSDATRALLVCAEVRRWQDQDDAAAALVTQASLRIRAQSPSDPELRKKVLRERAMQASEHGDHLSALELFSQLIEELRVHPSSRPSELATALHSRAISAEALGRSQDAVNDYREALELHQRIFGPGHILSIQTQSALAAQLHEIGASEQAQQMGDAALEQARQSLGSRDPQLPILLNQAAIQAYMRQDYAAAAPLLEEAIALNTRLYNSDHGDTLALLNNLSSIQRMLGRFDAARASANEVLTRLAGDATRSYNERQAHARLAFIAQATGDASEQAAQANWILSTLAEVPATIVSELHEALAELAIAQVRQGQNTLALATAQRLETATRKDFVAGTQAFNRWLARVAWVNLEAGQVQRALELSREVLGDTPPAQQDWQSSFARIAAITQLRALTQLNQVEHAQPWLEALRPQRSKVPADEIRYWQSIDTLLAP